MNKGLEEKIFFKLNLTINTIKKIYSEESIFGIYTYGDYQNIICIIIPTFERVCLNEGLINDVYKIDLLKNNQIKTIDIRYVYHATRDGYPEVIESLYTDYYIINPRYEHIYHKLFRNNRNKFLEGIKCGSPPEELKIAIMTIVRTAFCDNSKVFNFLKQITDSEKNAIEQIILSIGDEGTFSQAKVATAAGVSRPTMTNLIMKMKLSEVAEVSYLGNRGTYMKIIDDTLLNIRGK